MNLPRAHWTVGTVTLLLFPLAGVYMRHVVGVPQLDGVTRMVFRSRFLLLLLVAVVNLALSTSKADGPIRGIASVLTLAAPFPLLIAFFVDPYRGVQGSLWSRFAMYGLFVAGALLAIANRPGGPKTP